MVSVTVFKIRILLDPLNNELLRILIRISSVCRILNYLQDPDP